MNVRSIDCIYWDAARIEDAAERQAFLDAVCGSDTALRERIESLLALQSEAGSFLESPPVGLTDSGNIPEGPGSFIGPYKLLQKIGEGGMGAVYMAEQTKPVERRVALKIINPGMSSNQFNARFEAERQALAMMDHPNIARVLDAGATKNGRPYFVMELVKGLAITRYCDEKRLTPRQRVELFIHVCHAFQHAHQKGIIHRDIKPSNVMVCLFDGKPVPKVIDFGVAKATGFRLTDRTLFTEFGQVVGTLEYMSPEQAELNNLDVDTRSDIYALGVLLYELLTGITPLKHSRAEATPLMDILRIIREVDPPTPSNHLSTTSESPNIAVNRGVDPAKLSGLVRGELDWIVMKCLEKDRNRRYQTAGDLALDLLRYLADEPVEACPPSTLYRARKFVRKHRGPVLAACLVSVMLLAGIIGTSIGLARALQAEWDSKEQRDKAQNAAIAERDARLAEAAHRKQADAVANLIESLFRDLAPATPPEELKQRLIEKLDTVSADLERDFNNEPVLRARLRHTVATVRSRLGDTLSAISLYEQVLAERRTHLGSNHPDTLLTMRVLAGSYGVEAQRQAEPRQQAVHEKALRLTEEWYERTVLASGPDDESALQAKTALALQLSRTGDHAKALKMQAEVLAKRRELNGPDHPETIYALRNYGIVHIDAAKKLLILEQAYLQAKVKLGADNKQTLDQLDDLALQYQVQKKLDRATELFELNLELVTSKFGVTDGKTLIALWRLGDVCKQTRQFEKAIPFYVRALDGYRKYQPRSGEMIHLVMQGLASSYAGAGQYDRAADIQREIADGYRVQKGPDDFKTLQAMGVLGGFHALAGQHDKTVLVLDEVVTRLKKRPLDRNLTVRLSQLAVAYQKLGRLGEAAARFQEVVVLSRQLHGEDNLDTANAQSGLGFILLKQKEFAKAEGPLRESLLTWEKTKPGTWSMFRVQTLLGAALEGQKKFAEAEPLLLSGYHGVKKHEPQIPATANHYVPEALEQLVHLYEAWDKKDKAAEWRKHLEQAKRQQPQTKSQPGPDSQ